jgi:hypothetical protein
MNTKHLGMVKTVKDRIVAASESLSSDISRFFTGSPTDKAIWMLLGGVVATIIGLVGLLAGQLK